MNLTFKQLINSVIRNEVIFQEFLVEVEGFDKKLSTEEAFIIIKRFGVEIMARMKAVPRLQL